MGRLDLSTNSEFAKERKRGRENINDATKDTR
jgi:hypothetical protein